MAYLQSVGVQITESDLTTVVQPTSASIGAYVGHFNWGPGDEIINVSSEKRLGEIFGTPKSSNDATAASFLTAESFLKYGNSLKVVRAVGADARNSRGIVGGTVNATDNDVIIKNKDAYDLMSTELVDAFYARCPGTLGDSLSVQLFHADNTLESYSGSSELLAESKRYFSALPTTTEWGDDQGYADDEVHVIVYDKNGAFTGVKDAVLETFEGLSFAEDSKKLSGASNYWVDVIAAGSQYIFVGDVSDVFTETDSTYSLVDEAGLYTFAAGAEGTHATGSVTTALNIFADPETVDISLLFAEAFESDAGATINNKLAELASSRADCMAFLSAPLELYSSTETNKLTDVIDAKDDVDPPTSFVVFDSSPVYVYNKYADKYVWIPACGHMAGLCAYTDAVSDAWFSPAGYNRGQLRGVVKLAYNPVQTDRDELYSNNINPIINVAGQGIVLLGDKTGQTRPSAFDRINVRRLFITLQKACAETAKFQLFEFNDQFTRNTFINTVEPFLRDVQSRRGVTDYKIVCDESNNTPQIIDTNRFVADIYIKPARSINYITLNFIASRSGVEFNEIGA